MGSQESRDRGGEGKDIGSRESRGRGFKGSTKIKGEARKC